MKLIESIKIKLQLKRYSFQELEVLKKFVDEEYNKRKKNLFNKN